MPTVSVKEIDENGEVLEKITFESEVLLGEVVYDELDKAGHQLPHGCLAGSCGSCRVQILEGAELLSPPAAIEADTIKHVTQNYNERLGEGYLQGTIIRMACRAKIQKEGKLIISPLK